MITALSLLTILIAGMFVMTMFAAIAASAESPGHRIPLGADAKSTADRMPAIGGRTW